MTSIARTPEENAWAGRILAAMVTTMLPGSGIAEIGGAEISALGYVAARLRSG